MGFVRRNLVNRRSYHHDESRFGIGHKPFLNPAYVDFILVFRLFAPLIQFRPPIGDIFHVECLVVIHRIGLSPIAMNKRDSEHAIVSDAGQCNLHPVRPRDRFYVLNGRRQAKGLKLSFERSEMLLQDAGGMARQRQLLVVEIFADNTPHFLGRTQPKENCPADKNKNDEQHDLQAGLFSKIFDLLFQYGFSL